MCQSGAFDSIGTGRKAHEAGYGVERHLRCDYAQPMRRLPRPNSTVFRVVLSMALLAWTVLAFGMPAMPPPHGQVLATQSHAQAAKTCAHGQDMAMAGSESHHQGAPGTPMGHGDCCHGGCHCLSACNAALLVPFAATGVMPEHSPPCASIIADVLSAMAAPPLRPPIA